MVLETIDPSSALVLYDHASKLNPILEDKATSPSNFSVVTVPGDNELEPESREPEADTECRELQSREEDGARDTERSELPSGIREESVVELHEKVAAADDYHDGIRVTGEIAYEKEINGDVSTISLSDGGDASSATKENALKPSSPSEQSDPLKNLDSFNKAVNFESRSRSLPAVPRSKLGHFHTNTFVLASAVEKSKSISPNTTLAVGGNGEENKAAANKDSPGGNMLENEQAPKQEIPSGLSRNDTDISLAVSVDKKVDRKELQKDGDGEDQKNQVLVEPFEESEIVPEVESSKIEPEEESKMVPEKEPKEEKSPESDANVTEPVTEPATELATEPATKPAMTATEIKAEETDVSSPKSEKKSKRKKIKGLGVSFRLKQTFSKKKSGPKSPKSKGVEDGNFTSPQNDAASPKSYSKDQKIGSKKETDYIFLAMELWWWISNDT